MDWAIVLGLITGFFIWLGGSSVEKKTSSRNNENQPGNKTPFPTPDFGIVSAGSSAPLQEASILCCCPKGHKLRVKSTLAGKVGICPVCKLRFQVPFETTQEIKKTEPEVAKRVEILDSDPEVEKWLSTMRKTGPYQKPHAK